ncbi:unnamed protein product [Brassica oleracea]
MKKPTAVTQDEWVTAALTEDAVVVKLLLRLKHAGTVESAANTPLLRYARRVGDGGSDGRRGGGGASSAPQARRNGRVRREYTSATKEWSFDGISHTVSVLKHLGFLLDTRESVLKLEMLCEIFNVMGDL